LASFIVLRFSHISYTALILNHLVVKKFLLLFLFDI